MDWLVGLVVILFIGMLIDGGLGAIRCGRPKAP